MPVPLTQEQVRVLQLGNREQAQRLEHEAKRAAEISKVARRKSMPALLKELRKPGPVLVHYGPINQ